MKGIIIATHGNMAEGMLNSSKLFFGDQEQLNAYCLQPTDNPDDFVETLRKGIDEVDTGDGVIVFCDILFGSPCNCMARIIGEDLESDRIEVVTGVNLGMLLQALANRDSSLEEIMASAKDSIADFRTLLKSSM